MENIIPIFIHALTKAAFEEALTNNSVYQDQIAFIEDTSEIWAKGKYYPCSYTKEEIENRIASSVSNLEFITTSDANQIQIALQGITETTLDAATSEKAGLMTAENKVSLENLEKSLESLLPLVTPDYVDLGLPSGLLWATKNIGANTPEDSGFYFQWGDVQGYTSDQVERKNFLSPDYKFADPSSADLEPKLTKYCNNANYGKDGTFTDMLVELLPEDDAARLINGETLRLPTQEEVKELIKETDACLVLSDDTEIRKSDSSTDTVCKWDWDPDTLGDRTVKGVKFLNKTDATKYIFIPAVGCAYDNKISLTGSTLQLWSSDVFSNMCTYAISLVGDERSLKSSRTERYKGVPIRGVITESRYNYYTKEQINKIVSNILSTLSDVVLEIENIDKQLSWRVIQ